MFEKEAEERAERKISNFIPQQWGVILIRTEQTYETVEGAPHFYLRSLAKMWKEGAEYGYNKAKVEVEDGYRESLCNSELNLASVTEQLEELEKANEWHYVKDGDLPKDEDWKWCVSYRGYYYVARYEEMFGCWTNQEHSEVMQPYAWKEIVLPELKESE